MAIYQLKTKQLLRTNLDDAWKFISNPENLAEITPDYMGFDILTTDLPEKMYPGMIIQYKVRPVLDIPVNWVTEITQLQEKSYFIDEQRLGPYALWHHQHRLTEVEEGVLMSDIVTYRPPLRLLGNLINRLFIRPQLDEIFEYRKGVLDEIFNS